MPNKAVPTRKKKGPTFLCLDCKEDTAESGEYPFMLLPGVWREANPAVEGMLCVGCIEARLQRELTHEDFIFCPLNLIGVFQGSDRLRERMGADDMLVHALSDMPLGDISRVMTGAIVNRGKKLDAILNKRGERSE
jgi:hypothetical protein